MNIPLRSSLLPLARPLAIACVALGPVLAQDPAVPPATAEITRADLLDRIRGGWTGTLIGGLEGLPHEFKYKEQPRATLPEFTFLEQGARSDDDNDFEWPHLWFMDKEAVIKLPYPRLVEIWKANMNSGIWVANKRARELMDQGVLPPDTGSVARNPAAWFNLSGQFCVEAYGLIAPGMPQAAADIGLHYARIAVSEEPLQATQYWTSLISLRMLNSAAPEAAMQLALAAIDPKSSMAEVVADARAAHRAHPNDWKTARQVIDAKWRVQRQWNHNSSPLNGAAVCLALLYGQDDFYRTLQYAMALGYDADCNAATAATVVGARIGFQRIAALPQFKMPDHYVNKTRPQLPAECTVSEQAETLLRIAERVILAGGGERIVLGGQPGYRVKLQAPRLLEALPAVVHGPRNPPPAAAPAPLPYRVAARLADTAEILTPSAVRVDGWLGHRIAINASVRLQKVDTEPLLAGFKQKPGSHPWIGEHVGKWLHAATLAWANTGHAALRTKLDRVAAELIAAQEPDGYLGTYVPAQRFDLSKGAGWDVWSHKYCLVGLLTYHQYTGNAAALAASRRAADLLIATFPAKKSILAAGTHVGMASTSVLEPIVLLYRLTGEERYLNFAHYLVKSWDEPKGPAVLQTLLAEKQVNKVANAKAYEMLSNIVGLCDLARATGDQSLIAASLLAWQDIVARRLYLTGSASQKEHFGVDHVLPNHVAAHLGETCVTTTWIQLNLSLLQLTGEARFGDELERTFYNHLTAAQHPAGNDWCYYTALEGRKQYDAGITCCHSSGPRGLALAPQAAYLRVRAKGGDTLLVSTFETSRATLALGGQDVTIEQQSGFPRSGESVLTLRLAKPATFAIKVRVPAWAAPLTAPGAAERDGWAVLPAREWKNGDRIPFKFTLAARLVTGEHTNTGRAALAWGPFVLAYEQKANPALPAPQRLGFAGTAVPAAPLAGEPLTFEASVVAQSGSTAQPAKFLTFADAGTENSQFRIWLRAPGLTSAADDSLLLDGTESRSRPGNLPGSINDGDASSLVCTFDGKRAAEDWYAVTMPRPITARRVVFVPGKVFHDGGWFDTSAGKPRVQVRRTADAPWETIGELADYPATTATTGNPRRLTAGDNEFTLKLAAPETFVAVRVIGVPASGDNPKQAFSSCAEIQAFESVQ